MNDLDVLKCGLAQLLRGERSPASLLGMTPRVLNGLYAMGVAARERGQHAQAEVIFRRCVQLDPFRADFWIALAASRQAAGAPADAGELYQIAALLTDDVAPVAYAAACFAEAGQVERARVLADAAHQHGSSNTTMNPWFEAVDAAVNGGTQS